MWERPLSIALAVGSPYIGVGLIGIIPDAPQGSKLAMLLADSVPALLASSILAAMSFLISFKVLDFYEKIENVLMTVTLIASMFFLALALTLIWQFLMHPALPA